MMKLMCLAMRMCHFQEISPKFEALDLKQKHNKIPKQDRNESLSASLQWTADNQWVEVTGANQ